MEFQFLYKKRKFHIDVKECRTIFQKALGLMFRKKSKPLLFIFSRETREPIHSFFCVPFVAIWFNDGKIVDVKCVKPWMVGIRPGKKFDRLLEIPANDKNFEKIIEMISH